MNNLSACRKPLKLRFVSLCLSRLMFAVLLAVYAGCTCSNPSAADFAGVVSSATPEASAAGEIMLAAGGNAIDAAVAVGFALAVTEPAMSGLGGQSQIIVHAPGKAPFVINGTSFAPRGVPATVTARDIAGHRATTIPTTVRVLYHAWENHGSGKITWAEILAPAIRYAEQGFAIGPFRHKVLRRYYENLRQSPSARGLFLHPDGSMPQPGEVWQQPALAKTLRRLASAGAMDFYTGEIAAEIAADMARNGGWITAADLAALPDPEEIPPLHATFRGRDVYTLPPPGGGWVVLQILNLLEQFPPDSLAPDNPGRRLHLARALRLAHRMRRNNPIRNLRHYENELRKRLDKSRAREMLRQDAGSGETTHYSVVDSRGMAVGVTASINAYYGAKAANARLGFLYNDYMHEFELDDPGHPFFLRPGAMPYSSMSPTIVAQDGRPVLVLGSPGSSRIISAVAQVLQLWVDGGISIQQAVDAPRTHVVPDSSLYLEAVPETADLSRFLKYGLRRKFPRADLAHGKLNPYFGGVHAIALENGIWVGAADPRRDGAVAYARPRR